MSLMALSATLHSAFVKGALETLWQGVGLLEIFGGRWFLIDV